MINFDYRTFWDGLQPKHRRGIVLGIVLTIISIIILLIPEGEKNAPTQKRDDVKRSVLTSTNTRDLGIEALSAKARKQEKNAISQQKEIEELKIQLEKLHKRRGETSDAQVELQNLSSKLEQVTQLLEQQGWKIEDIQDGYITPQTGQVTNSNSQMPSASLNQNSDANQQSYSTRPAVDSNEFYFRKPPVETVSGPELTSDGKDPAAFKIARIESKKEEEKSEPQTITLPAGSIMSGTLLNGMDAPAGAKASANPYPAIIRIQKNAILPNLFSSDVRECLVTMSGYGNLSTERVDMRGERMSCITEEGDVIDVELNAYVIGDDGKVGIRGTLVHRTGALLANTLMAGTLAGLGEALSSNPLPTISTSNRQEYQSVNSDGLKYGIGSGFGKGFEKLADYWLELAEQIFPVIEVEAAREVDVALTGSLKLTPRKTKS